MISAFGVDHGAISKAEFGFSSKEARKRTTGEIKRGSRMSAGHGNKQRMGAHTATWGAAGAGVGALEGRILGGSGKGAAIGTGIGAGVGALTGAAQGKTVNLQRSAHRNAPKALKRGDIRRLKEGERTTAFANRIVKD